MIAVALAAQKTLEIQVGVAALRPGGARRGLREDGDIAGTIDHIGLRSTRIRTLDRTIVIVPNSQIANASLETISARDKFWFHPVWASGMKRPPSSFAVVDGIRGLLEKHRSIDRESVRVRFFRLGAFSGRRCLRVSLRPRLEPLEIQEQLLRRDRDRQPSGDRDRVPVADDGRRQRAGRRANRRLCSWSVDTLEQTVKAFLPDGKEASQGLCGASGWGPKLPPSARWRLTRCTRCSAWTLTSADCDAFSAS